jgi:hypothetical protein
VARLGERRCKHRVCIGKPEEMRILGRLGVREKIILKCIFKK